MRSHNWTTVLAALCLFTPAVHAAPAPLEAYGRLPSLSEVTLSPDGTKIAFVKSDDKGGDILADAIGTTQPVSVPVTERQKWRSLQWADTDNLLITPSPTALPEAPPQ